MNNLKNLLTDKQYDLWTNYNKYSQLKVKINVKLYIESLIKEIIEKSPDKKDEIGIYFFTNNIPFNFTFFIEIILPAILDGVKNNKIGFNRMLAECIIKHYSNIASEKIIKELNISEIYVDAEDFLQKELIDNPKDLEAVNLLLNLKVKRLDFAIHEIPIDLLIPYETFSKEVFFIDKLLKEYNISSDKWKFRLDLLKAISFCWHSFLMNKEKYSNFSDYLVKNNSLKEAKVIMEWNKCLIFDTYG